MHKDFAEAAASLGDEIVEIEATELDLREDLGSLFVCPSLPKIPFSFN